jgi:hypothetical protein
MRIAHRISRDIRWRPVLRTSCQPDRGLVGWAAAERQGIEALNSQPSPLGPDRGRVDRHPVARRPSGLRPVALALRLRAHREGRRGSRCLQVTSSRTRPSEGLCLRGSGCAIPAIVRSAATPGTSSPGSGRRPHLEQAREGVVPGLVDVRVTRKSKPPV